MSIHKAKELLLNDELTHLSHLKMLELYKDDLEIRLVEENDQWGLLLLIPVTVSPMDMLLYATAEYIVYLAGSEEILCPMIQTLPKNKDLVFKLQSYAYKALVDKYYSIVWKKAFLSFTSYKSNSLADHSEVVKSETLNYQLLPLWADNENYKDKIVEYFKNGARAYSIIKEDTPISTCLVFKNANHIWEIGGVKTIPSQRGNGYAKKVVSAAIQEILAEGNIPRYQVADSNLPSIHLAESLGLKLFLKLDHYYYKGEE